MKNPFLRGENTKKVSIFYIWKYLKKHKLHLSINIFISLVMAGFAIAIPFLTKALTRSAKDANWEALYMFIGILIGFFFIRILASFIYNSYGKSVGIKIEVDMRKDSIAKLHRLKMGIFDYTPVGKFISRSHNDLKDIPDFVITSIFQIVVGVSTAIGGVTFAFLQNWIFGVAFIGILVFGTLIIMAIKMKWRKHFNFIREVNSEMSAAIGTQVDAITEIKSYSTEIKEQERFNGLQNKYLSTYKKFFKFEGLFYMTATGITLLTTFTALIFGSILLAKHEITMPQFIGLTSAAALLNDPISKISSLFVVYSRGSAALSRFVEFLEWDEESTEGITDISDFKGNIEFNKVNFSYKDADGNKVIVFKDMSFKIKQGQKVAFVGETGIGKSTILKLLLRYYEIDSGEILIDGININKIAISPLRKQIGYLQQQSFIFDESMKNNIKYGSETGTDEEALQSARDSYVDEFISTLPEKYDTRAGRNGSALSGGQKQRISISRLFMSKFSILLLDEATSALDNETEVKIKNSIAKVSKNKTTLIVAHRLSTIKDADEIILLGKGGKIKERGTYKELDQKGSQFYSLNNK